MRKKKEKNDDVNTRRNRINVISWTICTLSLAYRVLFLKKQKRQKK